MKKLLMASLLTTTLLLSGSLIAHAHTLTQEQIEGLLNQMQNSEAIQSKLEKKLEKILKNQDEIKSNQKEILLNAKLPREQHTHYGFLSPHPLTALIMVGVPGAAAVLILALMKS